MKVAVTKLGKWKLPNKESVKNHEKITKLGKCKKSWKNYQKYKKVEREFEREIKDMKEKVPKKFLKV